MRNGEEIENGKYMIFAVEGCLPMQAEMRITEEQRENLLTARRYLLRRMREIVYARRTILAQLGLDLISTSAVPPPPLP
jgi:hypothetical protein